MFTCCTVLHTTIGDDVLSFVCGAGGGARRENYFVFFLIHSICPYQQDTFFSTCPPGLVSARLAARPRVGRRGSPRREHTKKECHHKRK